MRKLVLIGATALLAAMGTNLFAGTISVDVEKLFVYESEKLIPVAEDTTGLTDSVVFLNKGWRARVERSRNPGAYILRITPNDSSADTTTYSVHLNGYSPSGILVSQDIVDTVTVGTGADVLLPIGIEYARYSYSGYIKDVTAVDSNKHVMPKEMEVYRAIPMEFIYKK